MPTDAVHLAHNSSSSSDSTSDQHSATGAAAGAGQHRLVYFRVTDVRPTAHAQPDAGGTRSAGGAAGAGGKDVDPPPKTALPLLVSPEHTALTLQVSKGVGQASGRALGHEAGAGVWGYTGVCTGSVRA